MEEPKPEHESPALMPDQRIAATRLMARAMQESPAWPAVFAAGSAHVLADAALAALRKRGLAIVPTTVAAFSIEVPDQPWLDDEARRKLGDFLMMCWPAAVEAARVDGGR